MVKISVDKALDNVDSSVDNGNEDEERGPGGEPGYGPPSRPRRLELRAPQANRGE
ncbi:hypothetical protein QUB10_33330 [Microcoleus sp. B5-D4]|uniref:hypothetical protein n=1 Tax=unclassified Microcoleus TaxID=2642155 RepID=UPI002FD633F5